MNLSELSALIEDQAREKLEAIRHPPSAIRHPPSAIRWPNGRVCAHCGCVDNITKLRGKKHRAGQYFN